jgi:hypothetical protein
MKSSAKIVEKSFAESYYRSLSDVETIVLPRKASVKDKMKARRRRNARIGKWIGVG